MSELTQQKCAPLKKGATPTSENDKEKYLKQLPDWDVLDIEGINRLNRSFSFDDFNQALKFTNKIGEIAEEQEHHPLITLTWGKVIVQWWTHSIGGLHKNDFIMAAKTSQAFENF